MICSQLPEVWFSSIVQRQWPPQLCGDARIKVLFDHALQSNLCYHECAQQLIAVTFGVHMDRDILVVGAAADDWCKGTTHLEVKPHCHHHFNQ